MSIDHIKDTCSGCGRKAEKYMSGTPICWDCWYWSKLDGPAARHWAKVGRQFLSNVDTYDFMHFSGKCGMTQNEFGTMLESARKLTEACEGMIEASEKRWIGKMIRRGTYELEDLNEYLSPQIRNDAEEE